MRPTPPAALASIGLPGCQWEIIDYWTGWGKWYRRAIPAFNAEFIAFNIDFSDPAMPEKAQA